MKPAKDGIQTSEHFFPELVHRGLHYFQSRIILPYKADVLIISHPKAGRTWVRIILNEIFRLQYGYTEIMLKNVGTSSVEFFELAGKNKQIPKILFTHLGSDGLFWLRADKKTRLLRNKKVVILVRDPRDVMVSYYFQLTRRTKSQAASKKNLSEFLRSKYLRNCLNFMNAMERFRSSHDETLLLKYEDLHRDTIGEMKRLVKFMGVRVPDKILEQAVAYGGFENMHEMERRGFFAEKKKGRLASALETWDVDDKEAYKVRRGKVGGYVDYLDDGDIAYLNAQIEKGLAPSLEFIRE